jgi:hypothetical protein
MTKEQLAEKLNGRECGSEIRKEEELEARAAGLVVIFGYSDDNAELRGAISDEFSCYDGSTMKLHRGGLLPGHPDRCDCQFCGYVAMAAKCASVELVWSDVNGYSWTYKTDLPHATFDIVEGEEKYCRGIVFEISALPTL